MNQNQGLTNLITGGQPIGFEVKLETKSLLMLGFVIFIAAVGIITYSRLTKN